MHPMGTVGTCLCSPSPWEAEAESLLVQDQPGRHSETLLVPGQPRSSQIHLPRAWAATPALRHAGDGTQALVYAKQAPYQPNHISSLLRASEQAKSCDTGSPKVGCPGWSRGAGAEVILTPPPAVPELAARGIIQQVFPVHEQRILNRLMKSWVQAVCENQPLGVAQWPRSGLGSQVTLGGDPDSLVPWQMTSVTTLG